MQRRNRRRNRKIIVAIASICGVATLLIAVYLGMAFYFDSHFFFRTKINGWEGFAAGGGESGRRRGRLSSHGV